MENNKNETLKNIYAKEEVSEARKQFWEQMDVEALKEIKNENMFEWFQNNYPRAAEETTKHDWISFMKGLENCGIEYISQNKQQLKDDQEKKLDLIKNAEFKLELTFAANAETNKFAIVDKDGNDLWDGKEFNNLYENQWEGECDAAKKAIWIAKQIKEQNNLDAMVLVLNTSNGAFKFQSKLEQKSYFLTSKTLENNIGLVVNQIGNLNKNPAYKFTTKNGFNKFNKEKSYANLLEKNNLKNLDLNSEKIKNNEIDLNKNLNTKIKSIDVDKEK